MSAWTAAEIRSPPDGGINIQKEGIRINLKEAFRYQKFLDYLMQASKRSIAQTEHCLKFTKHHLRHQANPDAEDKIEEVEPVEPFFPNDRVIDLMVWLTGEKQKLSVAIEQAKAGAQISIDAAIETNKFRHFAHESLQQMLTRKAGKRTERGSDFKFNNDGVQTPYYYDVELTSEEAFDRARAKEIMNAMINDADTVSAQIDAVLINTVVDYEPLFNVNANFDDVMTEFIIRSMESGE